MKFKFIISAIFFYSTIAVAASMQASADELAQLLNDTHTMQATFEQFAVNSKGVQVGQKTTGLMMLERPGKFRWETKQPSSQLIIINGAKLWVYDIDLEQVTKRKMDYQRPGNPAMLLSGSTATLKQMFKITKLKKPGEGIWFELKPKSKNSDYKWLRMWFIKGLPTAMYVFDNLGQQSEIHFADVVVNAKIPKDKFIFVAPKNVDVLDEEQE
ncbi:MAG: outer-membrane lipoprotein carrier protein [uncultured bacterium]|nr:MAG: outer-membrane lipoprotein carrier protein [uncultured bacterium]